MIRCPDNLFCLIEAAVLRQPSLLKQGHWHTRKDGSEATLWNEILDKNTAHCLMGWIVAMTPGAARGERCRLDVDEYAQELLVASGRMPIPSVFRWEDEVNAMKIIRGRAAEERALEAKKWTAKLSRVEALPN